MHSNSKIPGLALALLFMGLISYMASAVYCTHGHAEVVFIRDALRIKQSWARQIGGEVRSRVVVCGGSSAAFGIVPSRIQGRIGRPVINMGLHAGLGPRLLASLAQRETKPGDTFVVAFEPPLLNRDWNHPALGIQLAMASGLDELVDRSGEGGAFGINLSLYSALRPGAWHTLVLAGRLVARKPLGRYSSKDLSPDGWQQTTIRWNNPSLTGESWKLSKDSVEGLRSLVEWGKSHNIVVVYALPWAYGTKTDARLLRGNNLRLLREIAGIMPVITGSSLGAVSDPARFLDSEWHLDATGAESRSDELADALRSQRYLSASDLDQFSSKKVDP